MESSPVTVPVVRTSIVTLVQEISIHMARVLTFPVVHSEETWSTWLTQHWLCICSLNPLLLFYDMNVSRRHRLELVFSISVHFLPETPVFYGSGDDWDAWTTLLGFFSHPLWKPSWIKILTSYGIQGVCVNVCVVGECLWLWVFHKKWTPSVADQSWTIHPNLFQMTSSFPWSSQLAFPLGISTNFLPFPSHS